MKRQKYGEQHHRSNFNPNPPGQIKPCSATNQTLDLLLHVSPRYLTRALIVEQTGRSPRCVDWALFYLRSIERIEARNGGVRCGTPILKYRIRVDDDD